MVYLHALNVCLYLALGALTAWAVLDHRVNDGIVCKLGLIIFSLSCGAGAHSIYEWGLIFDHVELARNCGLVIAILGHCSQERT